MYFYVCVEVVRPKACDHVRLSLKGLIGVQNILYRDIGKHHHRLIEDRTNGGRFRGMEVMGFVIQRNLEFGIVMVIGKGSRMIGGLGLARRMNHEFWGKEVVLTRGLITMAAPRAPFFRTTI